MATVEQFVIVHHPIAQVVNLSEDARRKRVVEVQLASGEQALALNSIPIALDECRKRCDERSAFIGLHRAA